MPLPLVLILGLMPLAMVIMLVVLAAAAVASTIAGGNAGRHDGES